jgi:hypothetical protein
MIVVVTSGWEADKRIRGGVSAYPFGIRWPKIFSKT